MVPRGGCVWRREGGQGLSTRVSDLRLDDDNGSPNVEPWNCGNAVSASARQDELKQADGSKPRINRGFAAAIRSLHLLYTM